MAKGGGSNTVTQTIPDEFKPYYEALFREGGRVYHKDAKTVSPYAGPMVAQGNVLERQGLQGKADLSNQFQGLGSSLTQLGQDQAQGRYLDVANNPHLQNALRLQTQVQMEPLMQAYGQARQQAGSNAIGSGAYKGSSRRDLLEGQLAGSLGQNVQAVQANLANTVMDQYNRERAMQQGAGQLMTQGTQLAQLSPELQAQAGAGFRALEQMRIQDALGRYDEAVAAPYRPIFPWASIIQGTNVGSTRTSQLPQTGGLGGGIVGALGGAATGAGIGSLLGDGYGGWGAGIGGLLGGLGGALA